MKRKKAIFYLMCVIALAAAAAVIGFLVYTLKLRTDFRADAMEINNMFLKKGIVNVSCGEESFQFPAEDLEYYDKFLLDRNTVVFSRKLCDFEYFKCEWFRFDTCIFFLYSVYF